MDKRGERSTHQLSGIEGSFPRLKDLRNRQIRSSHILLRIDYSTAILLYKLQRLYALKKLSDLYAKDAIQCLLNSRLIIVLDTMILFSTITHVVINFVYKKHAAKERPERT